MITRVKSSKKVYDRKKEKRNLEFWGRVRIFTV
jgi:hypothetical protein